MSVITPASLEAIGALTRQALLWERERESRADAVWRANTISRDLLVRLEAVGEADLLRAIRRHRLENLLQADVPVGRLLPGLQARLKHWVRVETMAALALVSLTREIAALFERAGIPLLVLKGVPLSLQTTGALSARGRGDLDLLVDPRRLPEAVQLLEQHGFVRKAGNFPRDLHGFWGRYSRWVGYELSLMRQQAGRHQWIDLHWALSNVRAPLPGFQEAWACRDTLTINGQAVATLCRRHAFQHACAHAAKDQWMCLRNLVDIQRLARGCDPVALAPLRCFRMVRWSCLVAQDLSPCEAIDRLAACGEAERKRVIQQAQLAQRRGWRSPGEGRWSPGRWVAGVARMLLLSLHGEDWLRTLLYYMLLPAAFSDPVTGQDRGLLGFIQARIQHLRQRVRESR